jgi:5'(3')-deoxyribonucleotidase
VGIISWLSKNSTPDYDAKVTEAKKNWLKTHLPSVEFDEINIVPYGTAKEKFAKTEKDILFDDEEKNRQNWTGEAFGVENILEILRGLN